MAQTKTIQLLRSSSVYTSAENARQTVGGMTGQDGEIRIARYNAAAQGEDEKIQSMLCIYHKAPQLPEGKPAGWTFIEDVSNNADSPAALKQLIEDVIAGAGLNNDGSYTGHAAGSEIVGKTTTLNATVEAIISYLQRLDKTASAVDGQVVTTVTQTNGAVTETKANVKDLQLGGYSKDTSATGAIGSTDTVNTALSKLENNIAANDTARTVSSSDQSITVANSANGTDVIVNVDGTTIVKDGGSHALKSGLKLAKITEGLSTNVKEAYQLQDASGNQIGNTQIDIYKDSALKEVYLGASTDTIDSTTGEITKNTVTDPQSMNFAYQLADGTYSLTKVDVSKFLTESEFSDGLQVNGGVVSVKVDSTSESFLTVGSGGVKLSGVKAAIDAVKVTTDNTGATYVNLAVDNAGRALTLTNTMQTMASADSTHKGLAEASDVKSYVDAAVANKNVTAEGDDYVSATAADNKVTVDSNVQNLTFTQGSGSTDSTLSGTAKSLADGSDIATNVSSFTNARISEEIAKLDSSVKATAADGNQYSVLTGVTETDGKLTAKTEVKLAAVAKTGAAADVTIADSSEKLTATNVEDALTEIVTKADASLNSVSSTNGVIAVAARDTNKNQALTFQVSDSCAKQADGSTNMLTIANDGLVLSDTWDCGVFD